MFYSIASLNFLKYLNSCFPHLNSGLGQVYFERHFLPHEDVRVPSLLEQRFKDVQLGPGEGCPLSSLLPVGWPREVRVGGVSHGVVKARGIHGRHGKVETVHTVTVLEVGHRGLGAAAGGEGREGQLAVRGQPAIKDINRGYLICSWHRLDKELLVYKASVFSFLRYEPKLFSRSSWQTIN